MYPTISSQTYQTGGQLSIDLHGSSVREAKISLQETFNTAEEKGLSRVTFITGVGKHSRNNYSVLFNKTVPEFLAQPEIKARISQVKRDHRGAYEVVFKNDEQSEKIEMLKKSLAPFAFPNHDFEHVKQKAEKGSADDQFNLGIRYLQGYGTEINLEEAERWIISAANNGHHYANTQLGLMYDLGYGVKQNYRKALRWHEKGAKQNEPYSLLMLGCYYWLGKIVVRDDPKAVGYLSRAAALNEHSAGCNLGMILLGGTDSVASDPLKAKELFESAAKANFVWGQVLLAKQYFFGWGIPQNLPEAHKWFKIASKQNDLMAQYYLGRMYNEGRGVPRDEKIAFEWFQKSAAQGDKDAKTSVARFLIEGTIVPQNIPKGIADLKDLAEQGHPQSAGTLGYYYLDGIKGKLKKNIPLAIKYLSLAAEGGDVSSLKLLASMHFKSEIERADPNIGENFLRRASKKNDPEAPFMLAMHLLKKDVSESEKVEVLQLLEQSAEQNYPPAEDLLGFLYLNGELVKADESRGLSLLMRAAKHGMADAQLILGEHLISKESAKEKLQAVGYFASAAQRGEGKAMMWLAYCYRDGIGIPANQKSYLEWLNKAEAAGIPDAFCEKGLVCQREKQDAKALRYFLKAAEKGCLEAKKHLYRYHLGGRGTRTNYAEGLRWLKEVFKEKPTPLTEHLLGCIYADPTKGHYNLKEAIHWFSLAITHGFEKSAGNLKELYKQPKAQKAVVQALTECAKTSLAALFCIVQLSLTEDLEIEESLLQKMKCYLLGQGTQVNVTEELRWLFGEEPNLLAEHLLGDVYANPTKGHYNLKEAIHWFSLAIKHGNERSVGNLKELYKHPKAQKAVVQALTKCAQTSHLSLLCVIQLSLKKGLEIEESLLQKVMESDDPYLQFISIVRFLKLNRFAEAKVLLDRCSSEIYKKAEGDPEFAYEIGHFYSCINEAISAMDWFSKASDQNHQEATIELFRLLHRKVQTDPTAEPSFFKKAFEKGLQAANFGDLSAQYMIAHVYLEGAWGVQQNKLGAVYWFQKAAEQGDTDAQIELDQLLATNENKSENVLPEGSSSEESSSETEDELYLTPEGSDSTSEESDSTPDENSNKLEGGGCTLM